MDQLKDDPLWPYLAEIIACPEAEGIILSGGFGLRLKQYLPSQGQPKTGRTRNGYKDFRTALPRSICHR